MMLFAQQYLGIATETRDGFAFWSDALGIAAFFASAVGLVVGLIVNQRVKRAKEEAKEAVDSAKREAQAAVQKALDEAKRLIGLVARSQIQRELGAATRTLELALEAVRSQQWVRAEGHLGGAVSLLIRLIAAARIEDAMLDSLRTALDNTRMLTGLMRGRTDKNGNLSAERMAVFDDTISRVLAVEAWFAHLELEGSA